MRADVEIAYVGFDIPNEFVVGYGLDYAERYRDLPFIGTLDPRSTSTSFMSAQTNTWARKCEKIAPFRRCRCEPAGISAQGVPMPNLTVDRDTKIYFSNHGAGPAVLMLHGWGSEEEDGTWRGSDSAVDHRVTAVY